MPADGDQSYLAPELRAGLQVVVVDRQRQNIAVDSVTVDNRRGAGTRPATPASRTATAGSPALVDDLGIETAVERFAGLPRRVGGRAAGDPELERTGRAHSPRSAEAVVTRAARRRDPPTALFCGRNVITIGAVRALQPLGCSTRWPWSASTTSPTADLLEPGVTTVRQDASPKAELAVDLLMASPRRLDGPVRSEVLRPSWCCGDQARSRGPRGSG